MESGRFFGQTSDDTWISCAENKLPLEHPRDPPHGVLADEDGRHENHVAPHEQAEEEAARALHNIEPRRPTAFPRFLVQSNSSDDIDCFTDTRILDVRETDFLLRPTLH